MYHLFSLLSCVRRQGILLFSMPHNYHNTKFHLEGIKSKKNKTKTKTTNKKKKDKTNQPKKHQNQKTKKQKTHASVRQDGWALSVIVLFPLFISLASYGGRLPEGSGYL